MWIIIALIVAVVLWVFMVRQEEGFVDSEIPKIIWTYWDSENLPEFIQKSIENWRKHCIGWDVRVVTPANLKEFLPDVDFSKFRPGDFVQRKVDLIRLYLIEKYGGLWSDASIAIKRSYDWIIDDAKGYEFIGYYREGSTNKPEYPVLENWLFAAIPNCEFVKKWRDEFESTQNYKDINDYIKAVKEKGVDLQIIPDPAYLTPYVSAQVVMQKSMSPDEIKNKLKFIKSDDGPFKHATENNWDPKKSMKWICDQPQDSLPDVIKVYGNERKAVEADPTLKCTYKIFE